MTWTAKTHFVLEGLHKSITFIIHNTFFIFNLVHPLYLFDLDFLSACRSQTLWPQKYKKHYFPKLSNHWFLGCDGTKHWEWYGLKIKHTWVESESRRNPISSHFSKFYKQIQSIINNQYNNFFTSGEIKSHCPRHFKDYYTKNERHKSAEENALIHIEIKLNLTSRKRILPIRIFKYNFITEQIWQWKDNRTWIHSHS